jgi:hypothetical protein
MKLSGAFGIAGVVGVCVAGVALAPALIAGCSSSGGGGGGSSSGGGSDNCTGGANCKVAPVSTGSTTAVTASHNYAIRKIYLGDYTRQGQQDLMNAWKDYGYNLDNLVTTRDSTDVCTLLPGTGKDVQVDGTKGIDNSFGANILPVVVSTGGDVSMTLNTSITNGHFTLMTYVTGFDDSNPGQTAIGLTGALLSGSDYTLLEAGAPAFTTATNWPISPNLLDCGGTTCPPGTDPLMAAKVKFGHAYVNNGTFVNGTPSDVELSLGIGGQTLTITAHSAILTFQQSAKGSVTNGTIAGVLDTMELLSAVRGIAGHISHSLCSGAAFMSIQTAILSASDIILNKADGTISNTAGVPCNAISIGLGFDAVEIAPPSVVAPPAQPTPDPCADAGSE